MLKERNDLKHRAERAFLMQCHVIQISISIKQELLKNNQTLCNFVHELIYSGIQNSYLLTGQYHALLHSTKF